MNIFIIPSWYPSMQEPYTGIFFQEQAVIYSKQQTEDNVGIGHWGPNDHRLHLDRASGMASFAKAWKARGITPARHSWTQNCHEYFTPSLIWTRRVLNGNIQGLVKATLKNLHWFEHECGKVDIIHAHVAYPAGQVAMRLSRLLGIPFVISEHMGPFPFPSFIQYGHIDRRLMNPLHAANKVLSVSSFLQEQLRMHGVDSEVARNYIDTEHLGLGEIPAERYTFLHVGRLEPEKNQALLLHAAALVQGDFKLRIGGTGSLRAKLEQLVRQLGLSDKVELLGTLTREDVSSEMQSADAFVLSSDYENFPVTLLEALSSGLPVIATKCGGPEEIISNSNGILVEVEDAAGLAAAMQCMLRKEVPFEKQAIRDDFRQQFGAEKATNRLRGIYLEVLG